MARATKSDILLLAFNNYVWATGWSAIKYSQGQMGPVVLNLWTLGISLLVLWPFTYSEKSRRVRCRAPLSARDYIDYGIMGFFGLTSMTLLYAWGARRSLAANGALISMSVPILTALIAVFVLGERLTRARILSFIAVLVGVLVISGLQWRAVSISGKYLIGNLLLLGGAVGNAVYVVYGKKLLDHSGPMTVLFWGQAIGFLGSIPFLYFEPFHLSTVATYSLYTWLALIFLGTIYFSFTMVIFYRILVRLDAGQVMIFTYLQPVFGVFMAVILLHERITASMVFGGLLVIGGTIIVALERPTSAEPL